jgi:hypothetical protein
MNCFFCSDPLFFFSKGVRSIAVATSNTWRQHSPQPNPNPAEDRYSPNPTYPASPPQSAPHGPLLRHKPLLSQRRITIELRSSNKQTNHQPPDSSPPPKQLSPWLPHQDYAAKTAQTHPPPLHYLILIPKSAIASVLTLLQHWTSKKNYHNHRRWLPEDFESGNRHP